MQVCIYSLLCVAATPPASPAYPEPVIGAATSPIPMETALVSTRGKHQFEVHAITLGFILSYTMIYHSILDCKGILLFMVMDSVTSVTQQYNGTSYAWWTIPLERVHV